MIDENARGFHLYMMTHSYNFVWPSNTVVSVKEFLFQYNRNHVNFLCKHYKSLKPRRNSRAFSTLPPVVYSWISWGPNSGSRLRFSDSQKGALTIFECLLTLQNLQNLMLNLWTKTQNILTVKVLWLIRGRFSLLILRYP